MDKWKLTKDRKYHGQKEAEKDRQYHGQRETDKDIQYHGQRETDKRQTTSWPKGN